MAFCKVPMALGEEQTLAPEGEYTLVVRKTELKQTKKGDPMVVLSIGFVGETTYAPFSHFVTFPKAGDSPDFTAMKVREIRRLCHVFGVDYTEEGFNSDDFGGAEGTCSVTVEVEREKKDSDGNVIPFDRAPRENNRLVLPRVVD